MKRTDFMKNKVVPPKMIFYGDFEWANNINRITSKCNLQVYTFRGERFIVAKEIPENKGMSITNAAETLWINVFLKFGESMAFETHDGNHYDLVDMEKVTYMKNGDVVNPKGDVTWESVGDWDAVLRRVRK